MRPEILRKIRGAITKVLKQEGISVNNSGTCMYRGPNNTRCIAGHCIPNREYKSSIEGKEALAVLFFKKWEPCEKNLIQSLQNVHDSAANNSDSLEDFRERFKTGVQQVAKDFDVRLL